MDEQSYKCGATVGGRVAHLGKGGCIIHTVTSYSDHLTTSLKQAHTQSHTHTDRNKHVVTSLTDSITYIYTHTEDKHEKVNVK